MFPISSSLSRPVIAKKALEIANENNFDIVLHTANQSQNSLRRLNGAIQSLKFDGYYGSPYEYDAITREEKAKFLADFGFNFLSDRKLSGDANLWCREYESGPLENPEDFTVDESIYKWSKIPSNEYNDVIKITFENGVPTKIDDKSYDLVDLIEILNYRVGLSGEGRYYGLEHLSNQEKVLEVREMPAASILMNAFKHLEMATIATPLSIKKQYLGQVWTQEAVEGRWYEEVAEAAYSFIANISKKISGSVTYKLSVVGYTPISIISTNPIYLKDRDSWEVNKAKSEFLRKIVINKDDIIIKELISNKFICLKGSNLKEYWDFFENDDWKKFQKTWSNLKLDKYMGDNGVYRFRKYSKYSYDNETRELILLPHSAYMQPSYINELNGDIERFYDPLDIEMTERIFFKKYLKWLGDIFSKIAKHNKWLVNIHPYRIIANEYNGKPTPEGLHRDGVDFVTSLLIARENIKDGSGISIVTDNNENELAKFEMQENCDLCIFDDNNVKHQVTEIQSINNVENAYRDVLVVAFSKI